MHFSGSSSHLRGHAWMARHSDSVTKAGTHRRLRCNEHPGSGECDTKIVSGRMDGLTGAGGCTLRDWVANKGVMMWLPSRTGRLIACRFHTQICFQSQSSDCCLAHILPPRRLHSFAAAWIDLCCCCDVLEHCQRDTFTSYIRRVTFRLGESTDLSGLYGFSVICKRFVWYESYQDHSSPYWCMSISKRVKVW